MTPSSAQPDATHDSYSARSKTGGACPAATIGARIDYAEGLIFFHVGLDCVVMGPAGSLQRTSARFRRLRLYRGLVNVYPALLAVAMAVLVFRWVFPWLFSVLVYFWAVDAFLLLVLTVPWLLVSWAFAFGKIKCPACDGPFASKLHLLVPKTCANCGCDVTAPQSTATSNHR